MWNVLAAVDGVRIAVYCRVVLLMEKGVRRKGLPWSWRWSYAELCVTVRRTKPRMTEKANEEKLLLLNSHEDRLEIRAVAS